MIKRNAHHATNRPFKLCVSCSVCAEKYWTSVFFTNLALRARSVQKRPRYLTGQYVSVLIGKYSRYPEAGIIKSTSAKTVIPKLDAIFARHGIPYTFKSDNGPPFNTNELKQYLPQLSVKHETSTPDCRLRKNSEAETFMKPLGKAMKRPTDIYDTIV